MSWLSRIGNVFRGGRLDRDLADELEFHLAARTEELIAQGLTPGDAGSQARRQFGNALAMREQSRDVKLVAWLESVLLDVRFGLRMLRKNPAVTGAAIFSLALAMGACTAAFSLIDALILRPLPVSHPEQLVYLTTTRPDHGEPEEYFSYPLFERCRNAARSQVDLFGMAGQYPQPVVFAGFGGGEEKLNVQFVSGDTFAVLGLRPAIGRLLTPADDLKPGAQPVAVLAYNYWMRRFGGNPAVLGAWFTYHDRQFQVVGVGPKGFTGAVPGVATAIWTPNMMYDEKAFTNSGWSWFRVLGRLRPGVTAERAREVLNATYAGFLQERVAEDIRPDTPRAEIDKFLKSRMNLLSAANGPSDLRHDFSRSLLILGVVAGLVLLIACTNLANLFTGRALAREREMAMRISIGAGRGRLIQQLLIEGALLTVAACVLGVLCAAVAAPALVAGLSTAGNPAFLDLHPDWRVLAFVGLAGLLTTLLFTLAPARRASRLAPQLTLGSGAGRQSARLAMVRPMVAAQIAFSFMVLFAGGLLLTTFQHLNAVNLGFDRSGVLIVETGAKDLHDKAARVATSQLIESVRQMPGVRSAAMSKWGLFSGNTWTNDIRIAGRPADTYESIYLPVSPDFFATMRIKLLAGRAFTAADVEDQTSSVIVNEAFVRRYFPGENPLGKVFTRTERHKDIPQQIVGLVSDAHYGSVRDAAASSVYIPLQDLDNVAIEVRSAGEPARLAPALRARIGAFGQSVRVTNMVLQSTLVDDVMVRERLLALLSGFFALVALALAAVGLYGVLSYSVVRRTREIGIRMALGARNASVVGLIMAEIGLVAVAGLAVGLAGGALFARWLDKLLFEVKPTDFWSLALPLASLLAVSAVAAAAPAVRAMRVDPAVALRCE